MVQCIRTAVVVYGILTLITGVLYPLVVTGVSQALFHDQANGSVIIQGDKAVGSSLIGQSFDDARYFWGRPSATGPAYNAAASSGSNLGPINPALLDAVSGRVKAMRAAHPTQTGAVPGDLVTASGSGLDPDISPAAAFYQVDRVAAARGVTADKMKELVVRHTEQRTLGVLGEPRVNVLALNLALDAGLSPPR